MAYEAPEVQVVGSLHDLTQTTKYVAANSDGYYLGEKGSTNLIPLNS